MNIENMSFKDYFDLFCFIVTTNQRKYKYQDWIPTEEDIDKYNEALDTFKIQWDNNREKVEKTIVFKGVKRSPEYIERLQKAHEFEVFVENKFKEFGIDIGLYKTKEGQYAGETEIGLEIKYDQRLKETGNIYIEYQEKRDEDDDDFFPSGILKQDNTKWWLIGDKQEHYFIHKDDLLKHFYKGKLEKRETPTSKAFLLSREEARKMCITNDFADFIGRCL